MCVHTVSKREKRVLPSVVESCAAARQTRVAASGAGGRGHEGYDSWPSHGSRNGEKESLRVL